MRKIYLLSTLFVLLSFASSAQVNDSTKAKKTSKTLGIGIKAGLNFSNVTNISGINGHSQTGFHAGLFIGGSSTHLLASRTELLYSQQGYGFSSDSVSGSNALNYIMLAQLMAVNITHFVQIQFGVQMGYLLNAKLNSNMPSTGNASADKILSLYNRFDYGFAGGIEIHPLAGLLVGARYSISMNNLYKEAENSTVTSGVSNSKNNVVQIFCGYRF